MATESPQRLAVSVTGKDGPAPALLTRCICLKIKNKSKDRNGVKVALKWLSGPLRQSGAGGFHFPPPGGKLTFHHGVRRSCESSSSQHRPRLALQAVPNTCQPWRESASDSQRRLPLAAFRFLFPLRTSHISPHRVDLLVLTSLFSLLWFS